MCILFRYTGYFPFCDAAVVSFCSFTLFFSFCPVIFLHFLDCFGRPLSFAFTLTYIKIKCGPVPGLDMLIGTRWGKQDRPPAWTNSRTVISNCTFHKHCMSGYLQTHTLSEQETSFSFLFLFFWKLQPQSAATETQFSKTDSNEWKIYIFFAPFQSEYTKVTLYFWGWWIRKIILPLWIINKTNWTIRSQSKW